MKDQSSTNHEPLSVRPLEARDLTDALEIFPDGLMHLRSIPPSFGAEGSLLQEVSSRQNAWVAEAQDRLIGLVVLLVESQTLAHLMYLHVAGDSPHHARATRALADAAIRKAWDAGCLKLVVHTHIPANHVVKYMHVLGFEFGRIHSMGGKPVVEFYRNIYEPPRDPSPGDANIQHFQ